MGIFSKVAILVIFSLFLYKNVNCKNYYLLNNEEANAKYVSNVHSYSLFGLSDIVSKYFWLKIKKQRYVINMNTSSNRKERETKALKKKIES